MRPKWVAKPLSSDPEPFRSSDPVLNPDTESTQSTVICLLLISEFPVLWLLVWTFQVPMFLVVPLVRTVRVEPCLPRQLWSIATDRQVMVTAGVRGRGADDTTIPGNDVFVFTMALLLRSNALAVRVRVRTLDRCRCNRRSGPRPCSD